MDWTYWGKPYEDDHTFMPLPEHLIVDIERQFADKRAELKGFDKWIQERADRNLVSRLRQGEPFYPATIDTIAKISWWSGVTTLVIALLATAIYVVVTFWAGTHLPWWLYWPLLIGFWGLYFWWRWPKRSRPPKCSHEDMEEISSENGQRSVRCRTCGENI